MADAWSFLSVQRRWLLPGRLSSRKEMADAWKSTREEFEGMLLLCTVFWQFADALFHTVCRAMDEDFNWFVECTFLMTRWDIPPVTWQIF